jgi:GNAT superfamily N-acetyltransferase
MVTVSPPIRVADPADAPALARVHLLSWQTAYRGHLPDAFLDALMDGYSARVVQWEGILAQEHPGSALTFVVDLPGEGLVGFASVGPAREGSGSFVGEVYAIYLLAGQRGCGHGRELMLRCSEHLRSLGLTNLMVWMLQSNPAGAFYHALGGRLVEGMTRRQIVGGKEVTDVVYGWERLPTAVAQ